jgi:hypothetical protein
MNSTRNKGRPRSEKRTPMSAQQATLFDRFSVGNASIAESALDCGCKAYEAIFTYNRWKAQGYQVKRGQKAVRLPMVKDVEREAENGESKTKRIFTTSSVFCRHQVEPIQTTAEPTPPAPAPLPFVGDFVRGPKAIAAQQPSANPIPVPQPRIDEIMGNWKEIS